MSSVDGSESSAPQPEGRQLPSLHPVFAASRARSGTVRGRGKDPAAAGEEASPIGTRLVGLSLAALESAVRGSGDDEESNLFSEDDEEEDELPASKRPRDDTDHSRRSTAADAVAAVAASAFPGSEGQGALGSDGIEPSDADSTSEARFDRTVAANKRIFSIRGVSCLGCSLDRELIAKVDDFVKTNLARLEPTALYKASATYWKNQIVEPAAFDGAEIPLWHWKDLRSHYLLHNVSPDVQRVDSIRSLASCRKLLEQSLVRQEEDGSTALDPKNAELLMKLVSLQSKELQLLGSSSMPPPPPRPPRSQRS